MTSKARPAPKPVDQIKSDLQKAATTSPNTVELLRELLGRNDVESKKQVVTKKAARALPTAVKSRPQMGGPPRRPASKKPTQVTIHEDAAKSNVPRLDDKASKSLATETFNATLKSLTAAAKNRRATPNESPGPKPKTVVSSQSSPLKEASLNRRSSPKRDKFQSKTDAPLEATVECAMIALEALRSLESEGKNDSAESRVEQGALVLLDKTITLELTNQAEQQIRRLYEQYWKRRKTILASKKDSRPENALWPTFAVQVDDEKSAFKLATSIQSHFLRLAILKDFESLNDDFVHGMRPETPGSPAHVVLGGCQLKHLDDEACGLQLRTISLALSKLQSLCLERSPSTGSTPGCCFQLAIVALQIKISSWKFLNHQLELQKDLWTPVKRHLQRFMVTSKDAKSLNAAKAALSSLTEALSQSGFPNRVPPELDLLIGNPPAHETRNTESLEQKMANVSLESSSQDLLSIIDSATARLDGFPKALNGLQKSLEQLRARLDHETGLGRSDLNKVFMKLARVRKSLVEIVSSAGCDVVEPKEALSSLQVECIRAVHSFLIFSLRCAKHIVPPKQTAKEHNESSLALTYAKNIEAVLLTEQHAHTRNPHLAQECTVGLHRCLEMASVIRSETFSSSISRDLRSFFEGVPLRISHAFWDRYLWLTEHGSSSAECVKTLEMSIDATQSIPFSVRTSASLSLKYERLARLLEEDHCYSKAASMYYQVVSIGIESGHLNDAVNAYTLHGFTPKWSDKASTFYHFGNHLVSFSRVSLKACDPDTTSSWLCLQDTIPELHRFVMAEHQITTAIRDAAAVTQEQLRVAIHDTLGLVDSACFNLFQLLFTSRVLFLLNRSESWIPTDFFNNQTIKDLITESETEHDNRTTAVLRILISSQWSLTRGELDEDSLSKFVKQLRAELGQVSTTGSEHCGFPLPEIVAAQLRTSVELAGVLGNHQVQCDALGLLEMVQKHTPSLEADRLRTLIELAITRNRLNDTTQAGKDFVHSEKLIQTCESRSTTSISWTLGYAEYLFNIANATKAKGLVHEILDSLRVSKDFGVSSSKATVANNTNLCEALLLLSRIALHQGQLDQAMDVARQAIRLSSGLWMSVEKKMQTTTRTASDDSSVNVVTADVSSLTLSAQPMNRHRPQGARFWNIIALHRHVLHHLAFLFSQAGLFEDALYYSQLLAKLVRTTGGKALSSLIAADLGRLHAQAGQTAKAQAQLTHALALPSDICIERPSSALIGEGEAFVVMKNREGAQKSLDLVFDSEPWLSRGTQRPPTPTLRHVTPRKKSSKPATGRKGKQAVVTLAPQAPPKSDTSPPVLTVAQIEFASRAACLQNAILCLDDDQKVDFTSSVLPLLVPIGSNASATVSTALLLLVRALRAFSTDPVSNTLAETTLALPVKYKSAHKSGQMSLLLDESMILTPKHGKTMQTLGAQEAAAKLLCAGTDASQLLQAAFEMLRSIGHNSQPTVSSSLVSQMYKALSQITLMSSALAVPIKYSPVTVVLQSLVPKDVSRNRERYAIHAETPPNPGEESNQQLRSTNVPKSMAGGAFEEDFKDLLQEMPQAWSIVSISLNQDQKELLLSRVEAGSSPFLMRVPLGRPDADDTELREFKFADAKAELNKIIKLAAESSHDERGQGDKQARKAWFAERESLDCRLKTLLSNIENVWLGGFRGLLSSGDIDSTLLSRFNQSLSVSLDNHLPSRQKVGKPIERVDLHAHVLELFVRLPFQEDSPELEDSIADLLYFVIDILQFNGEPNAYDEIDFDALLVDILDALRSYHAMKSNTPGVKHTILILDKELEAFPWESLPILHHRSVCRMPSLGAIKERLDRLRAQSPVADAVSISLNGGAYILNPSGDLTSTQSTFEQVLSSSLHHYDSLVNTSPTETQFQSLLTSNPLLLYFGHGSGAQYIRKRLIRRLNNVAVTWLMGCSSVKMTEVGEFESYGVCSAYVFGGSPAVVGTLWDVTDRDLDRASLRGLAVWGLLAECEDDDESDQKDKGKGKQKVSSKNKDKRAKIPATAEVVDSSVGDANGYAAPVCEKYKHLTQKERRGKVTIGEAVSAAREACRLRYLNGAALVVYGVPVVLEAETRE